MSKTSVLVLIRSYDYKVSLLLKFLTSDQFGYASITFSHMTWYQLSLVYLIKTLVFCFKIQLPSCNQNKNGNYWKVHQAFP